MCKILQINKNYDKFAASAGCANGKRFSASGGFVPQTPHWVTIVLLTELYIMAYIM